MTALELDQAEEDALREAVVTELARLVTMRASGPNAKRLRQQIAALTRVGSRLGLEL